MVNKCIFVKQALVYFSVFRGFVDMETGEIYNLGYPSSNGQLFIDVHQSKIYGRDLMGSSKKHYSKKRILKKFTEYNGGDNNECE